MFFALLFFFILICLSCKPQSSQSLCCVLLSCCSEIWSCPVDVSTVVALPSTFEFLCCSCRCDQSDFLHLFQMFSCHHLVEGSFISLVHCQHFLKILSHLIYASVCVLIYNLLKQQYISKRLTWINLQCYVSIKWLVGLKNPFPNLFLCSYLYHYCLFVLGKIAWHLIL